MPGTWVKYQKAKKNLKGTEPYWRDGSMDPVKFIVQRASHQLTALEHVGYSDRWPEVARSF